MALVIVIFPLSEGRSSHDIEEMDRRCGAGIAPTLCGARRQRSEFHCRDRGEPGELCTATPDTAIGTAEVNFCEGFAQGAFSVEMQNLAAFRGPKLFWMPNPLPTRNEALSVCQMGTRLAGSHAGSIHATGCSGF